MRTIRRWLRHWRSSRRKRKAVAQYGWHGYPAPEDNPYRGTSERYSEMKWDQEHGYGDYS